MSPSSLSPPPKKAATDAPFATIETRRENAETAFAMPSPNRSRNASEENYQDAIPLMRPRDREGATEAGDEWRLHLGASSSDLLQPKAARRKGRRGRTCLVLLLGLLVGFILSRVTMLGDVLEKPVMSGIPSLKDFKDFSSRPRPSPTPRFQDRVVVTMRTGSSVLYSRLPAHLIEYERDRLQRPNLLIYSDWEAQVGDWKVKNALEGVSETIRKQYDFNTTYTDLQNVIMEKGRIDKFKDGWKLDRYKFMPLWDDAYRAYPNKDWYVGTEDDAFIFWKPFLRFLSTLDPSQQHYLGCANVLLPSMSAFANGGCSYIMSRGLMEATFANRTFVDSVDAELEHSCCGDGELGRAIFKWPNVTIKEVGRQGKQRFTGASPWAHVFTNDNWCEELLSLHHVDAWTMERLYRFADMVDKRLPPNNPPLYVDIHDYFLPSFLQNLSTPVERPKWRALPSSTSARTLHPLSPVSDPNVPPAIRCRQTCLGNPKCFVWNFQPGEGERDEHGKRKGECWLLEEAVTFGERYRRQGEGEGEESGWMLDRIQQWRKGKKCRKTPLWMGNGAVLGDEEQKPHNQTITATTRA
ncbi:hypothetical protein ACQY0O_006421 [Thecaphora frezii]